MLKKNILFCLIAWFGTLSASETEADNEFNATDFIMHHISDAHEFHIADWNGHPISMPLPIILWTEKGLVSFLSSEFHHSDDGSVLVERKGMKFAKVHEVIYQLAEGETEIKFDQTHHPIHVLKPLDFSLTKNIFSMLLSAVLMVLLFGKVAKSYQKNSKAPKGLAAFLEPLVLFVRDDIAIPNIGEKKAARYMPYLLTVFFFIWINNLIGLIPFFPFGSNLTGSIALTGVLAFFTFAITTFSGNKHYWKHIFATPGVPFWLLPIMVPVEVMGMFTKPIALMIRLFANITAGHIIILSLIALIYIFQTAFISPVAIGFALFIDCLELLVAALQAYVFTLLSALFIGQAVAEDHP